MNTSQEYIVIPSVAFLGDRIQSDGWPASAESFDEAIKKAKELNWQAFHYYYEGSAKNTMYPFSAVTGYEPRHGENKSLGVIMEPFDTQSSDS